MTRRDALRQVGNGFGMVGLASLLGEQMRATTNADSLEPLGRPSIDKLLHNPPPPKIGDLESTSADPRRGPLVTPSSGLQRRAS